MRHFVIHMIGSTYLYKQLLDNLHHFVMHMTGTNSTQISIYLIRNNLRHFVMHMTGTNCTHQYSYSFSYLRDNLCHLLIHMAGTNCTHQYTYQLERLSAPLYDAYMILSLLIAFQMMMMFNFGWIQTMFIQYSKKYVTISEEEKSLLFKKKNNLNFLIPNQIWILEPGRLLP